MRKSKLTPKVREKLIEALAKGNYITACCNYAGISESCFHKWVKRGIDELSRYDLELETNPNAKILKSERLYVEFLQSKCLAEAKAEMLAVDTIRDGFRDDWRAAMAFLERRFRERWGRNIIGFNDDTGANDLVNAFASALKDVDDELKNSIKH